MSNLYPNCDPRARALGFVNWCGDYAYYNANAVTATGEVEAKSVWLPFGVPISKVYLRIGVAGAGTVPTDFFVGIGNATKQLAQSATLKASASLTATGVQPFALNATFTPEPTDSASGLFYVTILQVGAFGTTPVQFSRSGGANVLPAGFQIDAGRAGTGQTALQTNGSVYSTALAAAGSQDFWVAVGP